MKFLFVGLALLLCTNVCGQQKEILIIGTMHDVPKIIKRSYAPLLRVAKKYDPESIYVEVVPPGDTLSLSFRFPGFVHRSDSLKQVFPLDEARFSRLRETSLAEMTPEDFVFLAKSYMVLRDKANYDYYAWLSKYGIRGHKKPLRNEQYDLTYRLAVWKGITYLNPMDFHRSTRQYYAAEAKFNKGDKEDIKVGIKLLKKDYRKGIIPGLLGRYGKFHNRPKSLARAHMINTYMFVDNEVTREVDALWRERNHGMAVNIAEKVLESPHQKSLVVVGMGHVVGLKEELEKYYPQLKVVLMYE